MDEARGSAYNGGPVPLAFVTKLGWENAIAIQESRVTCWDLME